MHIIGVVLDRDTVRAAVYNEEYREIATRQAASGADKDGAIAGAAELCRAVLAESGIAAQDVACIGAAVAPVWGCPDGVAASLEEKTGIKTVAESAVNAEALGEAYLVDVPSLIVLKIDDTVECGIVMDNKLYVTDARHGGAAAHMVIDLDGYECACGRRGCFEAYASTAGLRRAAAEAGVPNAETITVTALFSMTGDAAAAAQKFYADRLGGGITNIINLFQTHELVLEGAFTAVGDPLMKPIMEIILRDQFTKDSLNKCHVRFANPDADTALIGAALLCR